MERVLKRKSLPDSNESQKLSEILESMRMKSSSMMSLYSANIPQKNRFGHQIPYYKEVIFEAIGKNIEGIREKIGDIKWMLGRTENTMI